MPIIAGRDHTWGNAGAPEAALVQLKEMAKLGRRSLDPSCTVVSNGFGYSRGIGEAECTHPADRHQLGPAGELGEVAGKVLLADSPVDGGEAVLMLPIARWSSRLGRRPHPALPALKSAEAHA